VRVGGGHTKEQSVKWEPLAIPHLMESNQISQEQVSTILFGWYDTLSFFPILVSS